MENEVDKAQERLEHWKDEGYPSTEVFVLYAQETDSAYDDLCKIYDQAADKIVSLTSGQVDKITAMAMIRCRRSEVEKIWG